MTPDTAGRGRAKPSMTETRVCAVAGTAETAATARATPSATANRFIRRLPVDGGRLEGSCQAPSRSATRARALGLTRRAWAAAAARAVSPGRVTPCPTGAGAAFQASRLIPKSRAVAIALAIVNATAAARLAG